MFTTFTEGLQSVKKQVFDQVSSKLKLYVASPTFRSSRGIQGKACVS